MRSHKHIAIITILLISLSLYLLVKPLSNKDLENSNETQEQTLEHTQIIPLLKPTLDFIYQEYTALEYKVEKNMYNGSLIVQPEFYLLNTKVHNSIEYSIYSLNTKPIKLKFSGQVSPFTFKPLIDIFYEPPLNSITLDYYNELTTQSIELPEVQQESLEDLHTVTEIINTLNNINSIKITNNNTNQVEYFTTSFMEIKDGILELTLTSPFNKAKKYSGPYNVKNTSDLEIYASLNEISEDPVLDTILKYTKTPNFFNSNETIEFSYKNSNLLLLTTTYIGKINKQSDSLEQLDPLIKSNKELFDLYSNLPKSSRIETDLPLNLHLFYIISTDTVILETEFTSLSYTISNITLDNLTMKFIVELDNILTQTKYDFQNPLSKLTHQKKISLIYDLNKNPIIPFLKLHK